MEISPVRSSHSRGIMGSSGSITIEWLTSNEIVPPRAFDGAWPAA